MRGWNAEEFAAWYAALAQATGVSPDPDDPLHQYNYRQAFVGGAEPDENLHMPSIYKRPGHPNRFVDGEDTMKQEGSVSAKAKKHLERMK
jgi:hypothetical protein